ncbi:hypothetical protein FA95DRAFT_1565365, partial [Auriscalpium vulgare]
MANELPLDVHILIIEWVFRSSQHTTIDYTTLHACALVCRAWTPAAQRLLFRRIRCFDLRDRHCNMRLLVRTLSISPHIAALVRYIQIAWPDHRPDYGDVCLRLLELCPHVGGISFFSWHRPNKPLSAELAARLRAIQLRPVLLRMILVDNSNIRTIVGMCQGVRVLAFSSGYDHPLPPTVEVLEIYEDSAYGCLSRSHPLPALRYLRLITLSWPSTLSRHLISTGILPQLQSLPIKGTFPPAEVLDHLTQLKTLVVRKLPKQSINLPPTLQYFGYHTWGVSSDTRAELAVIPLRALPGLQLVTVTRFVERDVRTALEAMCRDIGVEFGTYESPHDFQRPQHID